MANRSDYSSILPRRFKRLISLMNDIDENQKRVVRKLFISAHAHAQAQRKIMLTQKSNVDFAPKDNKESDQPAIT